MIAAIRLVLFLCVIAVFLLPVWMAYHLHRDKIKSSFLKCFYRLAAWSWGINVRVEGELATARPLLLVSNHSTYLDVPVLGSVVPVRFTPKADVRNWPVIGYLCALAGCIFIDRRRSQTAANKKNLEKAITSGVPISVFPEGTTNNGRSLQPFRSSYFSLAEQQQEHGGVLTVQPVTVRYKNKDGSALTDAQHDRVAWYGDAEFASHLWSYLATGGVQAEVIFHTPVSGEEFEDRKALAQYCEKKVASALRLEERSAK